MTTTYYIPPGFFAGDQVVLPPDEARHAVQVLRQRVGDEIVGVDGQGGWHRIELTNVHKKNVVGRVLETVLERGEPAFELVAAFSMLKNVKRFEMFVEKACELGVRRIIPMKTARTEKSGFRRDRMEKILIAAMKQSGRSRLVQLDAMTSFEQMLTDAAAGRRLLCHESAPANAGLLQAVSGARKEAGDASVLVAIGPEGGFSDEEVDAAVNKGFAVVSLGSRRLRAETAAVTACAGIMLAMMQ